MADNTKKAVLILDRINRATIEFFKMLPHLRPGDVETWADSLAFLIKDSQMCPELLDESQKLACLTAAVEGLESCTNLLKETVDMTQEFGMTEEDLVEALHANLD